MGGKTAIVLGLVTGLVAGVLLVGAAVALVPGPVAPPVATQAPATVPDEPATPSEPAQPSASPTDGAAGEAFGIGRPAPPLALPLTSGEVVDIANFRGQPVWVDFMATSCPACVDELPSMADFQARYEDTGLVVLVVDVGEDEPVVEALLEDLGVDVATALDADGTAQDAWGASSLPAHFWVDADGIVRDGAQGGIGPDRMAQGLQTILPGVTVTP